MVRSLPLPSLLRVQRVLSTTGRYSFARSQSSGASEAKRRPLSTFGLATVGLLAYGVGSLHPPQLLTFLSPRPAPPPPQPDSAEGIEMTAAVESRLQSLPIVAQLRERQDEYYETRPFANYPEEKRVNALTSGTLRGPGKLAVPPILFARHDESESITLVHLGRSLCGHDGIIHGGLLATILDESLARTAFHHLSGNIGVTANLSINYRAPTQADQVVKITTKLEEVKGRKAVVSGRIEDSSGKLLVDAKGLFVEPKFAPFLKGSDIAKAIGKPDGKEAKARTTTGTTK